MITTGVLLALVALLVPAPCTADEPISLWREAPPPPLYPQLRVSETGESVRGPRPVSGMQVALTPRVAGAEEPVPPPYEPDRAWTLRQAARAIPRPPTPAEQGGASIDYCPGFLPGLHPERNLGQHCGDQLLSSPFLAQGEAGRNAFEVAWEEVERMHQSEKELLLKSALAGLYYWQHRCCPTAAEGALRVLLAEKQTGLAAAVVDAAAPALLDLVPSQFTGIPPDVGDEAAAIDLRVTTTASYKSVVDIERMLREAAARQLDGIAVTDLDHVEGVRAVEIAAERLKQQGVLPADFLVIPGEEVTTLSGPLLALFVEDRVQRGMTIKAAIDDIHRQGGIAILADPGNGSGTKLVRTMQVDGYLLRVQPDSAFRTLLLMGDLGVDGKPLLAASGARSYAAVGLPYSVVETPERSAESTRRALKGGAAYGATNLHMPIFAAIVFRPLVPYEKALASWFSARHAVETNMAEWIGADNVEIRTTYDEELGALLGLVQAPTAIGRLINGNSPLQRLPRLTRISADYSYVRIEYRHDERAVMVMGAVRW
jgi:hypothetical protein